MIPILNSHERIQNKNNSQQYTFCARRVLALHILYNDKIIYSVDVSLYILLLIRTDLLANLRSIVLISVFDIFHTLLLTTGTVHSPYTSITTMRLFRKRLVSHVNDSA